MDEIDIKQGHEPLRYRSPRPKKDDPYITPTRPPLMSGPIKNYRSPDIPIRPFNDNSSYPIMDELGPESLPNNLPEGPQLEKPTKPPPLKIPKLKMKNVESKVA